MRLSSEALRLLILGLLGLFLLFFLVDGLARLYGEFSAVTGEQLDRLFPSLKEIGAAWDLHGETMLNRYIPNTLWVAFAGLSIAIVLGLALAALMDLIPPVRWVLYPVLVLSQTIPTFAIAVLLILLFGFGAGPKIIVVVLFCFFAVAVNTLNGLQNTNPLYTDLLRSMGANPLQIWWKVRLPGAMPSFFSGVRLAATYCIVGAVVGEYIGGGDGLGKFLQRSYRSFKTDQVFLTIIIVAALSALLLLLVSLAETLLLRWRYAGQRSETLVRKIQNLSMERIEMLGRIFKVTSVFLLVLLLPLVVLGQEQPEYARLDERTAVKLLLDWTPNTNHTGFYVAQALGYYDDANLDVEIVEPTDLSVEQALDTGIAEFGIGFQEFSTFAMAEGAQVVSIAAIIQHNTSGFATIADNHPIKRPADLAPLTYAGSGDPTMANAILSRLLDCDGAVWDAANYVDVGIADPLELMAQKRVDFAWIYYAWQGIDAELKGVQLDTLMLMDYADCVPDYYTPILLTSRAMIDQRPEVVRAFTQASARGFAFAIEDPARAAQILLDAVPELDAGLVEASAKWLAEQYQADAPRWGEQKIEVWQGFTDFLVENRILDAPIDVDRAFTNDFLPGEG